MEGDQWYFQHLESISIRLDKIGPFPVTDFPDLSDERKAWMRDEIQTTKDVKLFGYLSREKGKEFARDWFKDGAGYALAAELAVPSSLPTGRSSCMLVGIYRI